MNPGFRMCARCGVRPIPLYGPSLCAACDPNGGRCVSCGEPVRRHRTRAGRWVGCRAAALRIVAANTVTTDMQAVAAAVNQDAPTFDLPFTLTAETARPRAIQLGLFGEPKDE